MTEPLTVLCVLALSASLLTTAGVGLWAALHGKRSTRNTDEPRWIAQVALQAVEVNRQYAASMQQIVDGSVRANAKALDVASTRADDQLARVRAENLPDTKTVVVGPPRADRADPMDYGSAFMGDGQEPL